MTLMTVHAAKGLEYPVVFLPGLEEELFPHFRAVTDESGTGLEEERRLMYVGLTRAMRRLFLSWARTRTHFGQSSWREPSRFLKELPGGVAVAQDVDEVDLLGDYDENDGAGLVEGDWVEHAHFGRGLVERLRGSGVNVVDIRPGDIRTSFHEVMERPAAPGADAWNPVFDVTPASLVDVLVTLQ